MSKSRIASILQASMEQLAAGEADQARPTAVQSTDTPANADAPIEARSTDAADAVVPAQEDERSADAAPAQDQAPVSTNDQVAAGEEPAREPSETAPAEVPTTEDEPVAAADASNADAAPVDADPDTFEASLPEVVRAETEIDENADAVDELEEIHQGLEAIALSLESSLQQGGLTPQSAQFFHIAYESYLNRLGEEPNAPALESFGGQTSRIQATTISLESVRETLTKIWEAIKAIVVRVRDAIAEFIKRLFDSSFKLRERAEGLKEAASKIQGQPKIAEVPLGRLAEKLAVGKKVDVSPTAIAQLAEVAKAAIEYDAHMSEALVKAYHIVERAVVGEVDRNDLATLQAALEFKPSKLFKEITETVNQKMGLTHGRATYATPVLPGNVQFKILVDVITYKDWRGFMVYHTSKEVATVQLGDVKVKTLNAAEIKKVAEECQRLVDLVEKLKYENERSTKVIKDGLKKLKISKDIGSDKVDLAKTLMSVFRTNAAVQGRASTKVLGWAITTAGAYLALAEKSLALHDKVDAKAGAAKAA